MLADFLDAIGSEWYFTFVVILPKTHRPHLIRDKYKIETNHTKYLTSTPQTVKVMKKKESMKNCHRLEKSKEMY